LPHSPHPTAPPPHPNPRGFTPRAPPLPAITTHFNVITGADGKGALTDININDQIKVSGRGHWLGAAHPSRCPRSARSNLLRPQPTAPGEAPPHAPRPRAAPQVLNAAYAAYGFQFALGNVTRVQSDSWFTVTPGNGDGEPSNVVQFKKQLRRGTAKDLNLYSVTFTGGCGPGGGRAACTAQGPVASGLDAVAATGRAPPRPRAARTPPRGVTEARGSRPHAWPPKRPLHCWVAKRLLMASAERPQASPWLLPPPPPLPPLP
jgi:hypothetical protein